MRILRGFVTLNGENAGGVKMASWQELFRPWILERGREYFACGQVVELFEELCQHPSFSSFTGCEAELRIWNPRRTLIYYTEILKREMDKANQRKDYRHLIRYLEKMKTYPNGDNAAQNLAGYWYGNHKNRPAMKDELLKAGYPQK